MLQLTITLFHPKNVNKCAIINNSTLQGNIFFKYILVRLMISLLIFVAFKSIIYFGLYDNHKDINENEFFFVN